MYHLCIFLLLSSILVGLMLLHSPALVNGISMVYSVLDIKCWVFQPATRAAGYVVGFLRLAHPLLQVMT